jgi:hypothetical protein
MADDDVVLSENVFCPECGSEQVGTLERLIGTAEVTAWTVVDGKVTNVADWGGYTEVHWDASETDGAACSNCGWNGPFDALVIASDDDGEDDA